MAVGAYAQGILSALTDWLTTADLYAVLVDQDYTLNKETHDFLNDITDIYGGTSKQQLDSQAVAIDLALDQVEITAAAEVFSAVAISGTDTVEAVIVFDNAPATDATRPLVAHDDGGSGFGLTPNGSNITYTPDPTNGIIYYDYGA